MPPNIDDHKVSVVDCLGGMLQLVPNAGHASYCRVLDCRWNNQGIQKFPAKGCFHQSDIILHHIGKVVSAWIVPVGQHNEVDLLHVRHLGHRPGPCYKVL